MKIAILCALVALTIATTIVEQPAWNGVNPAWNGWNGYNGWPAAQQAVVATAAPHWWDNSWGAWDPAYANTWGSAQPAWGNTWGTAAPAWGNTWGAQPAWGNTWGAAAPAWGNSWPAQTVVEAPVRVAAPQATRVVRAP